VASVITMDMLSGLDLSFIAFPHDYKDDEDVQD
jgi:hypothetical protein